MHLYSAVTEHDFSETTCFLCGASNLSGAGTGSKEHVFPKWLLERFNLWDQQLVLMNGTRIPYRKLVIPCCKKCNGEHLSRIEEEVKENFQKGAAALQAMRREVLMLWTLKIFFGLLYREVFLPFDRRAGDAGTIVSEEDMKQFQLLHYILQASRVPVQFTQFESDIPATLFVFDLHESPEFFRFDYRDDVIGKTLFLRLGPVGILACFDMGAQNFEGQEFFPKHQGRKLHPVQFGELGANLFLKAKKLNRVPKVMFSEGPDGIKFTVMPIAGLSTRPVFDMWEAEELAQMLQFFLDYPPEVVMPEPGRTATWLLNSDGSVRHFFFDPNSGFTS